ncbi:hypothetical protein QC762_0023830 [Podospora pseudocomata]|uniref:Uncharacterized protein n=1 Tax=Podospora pseudocomata TaxID=2093779 RepID=A0ABR0GZ22_9PEZI|nr:hypothetical protein QC762_0023830 [Podospora pseudocomata]
MLSEPSPEGLLTGSWLDASFPVPRWQMALHLQGFAYEQSSRRGLCDSALWNASPHSVPSNKKTATGHFFFFPIASFLGFPLQIAQAEEISNRRQRHQPNPRPFSDRSPNIPSTAAPVRYPYLRYKKKIPDLELSTSLSELGAASPDTDAPDPADTLFIACWPLLCCSEFLSIWIRPSRCASHCRSRSRYRYRYLPYGVSVGRNHHTRATSTTHDPRPTAWPTQQAR